MRFVDYFGKSGIYCFTNIFNNKKYIGQAICLYSRYSNHKSGNSGAPRFLEALEIFGWNGFSYEILEECSINDLNKRESFWINFYNTLDFNFGYNIRKGCELPKNILERDSKQKYCWKCENILSIENFSPSRQKSMFSSMCKLCAAQLEKDRYLEIKEDKKLKSRKNYHTKNKAEMAAKKKDYRRRVKEKGGLLRK